MIPTLLKRLPRSAVAPGLDIDDGDKRVRRARSVMVLADLPSTVRVRIKNRGGLLTDVETVAAAVSMLAERDFDAVIVDMKAPGGGTTLVKCLKAGVRSTDPLQRLLDEELSALASEPNVARVDPPEPDTLEAEVAHVFDSVGVSVQDELGKLEALQSTERRARQRHRLTPFYLVMAGEQQYAIVIDPPEHSYLEDGKGLALPDAVMCLDVGKLLLRGPAMA